MPATTGEPLQLNAYWGRRMAAAGEVAQRILAFQRRLVGLHPAFADLGIVAAADTPISFSGGEDDLARVQAALAKPGYLYTNPDPADQAFGPQSTLATGFSLALAPDGRIPDDAAVTIQVCDGGFDEWGAANHVMVALPRQQPAGLIELPLLIELMQLTAECWDPERAWLLSKPWRRSVTLEDNDVCVGWLTYLAQRRAHWASLGDVVQLRPLARGTLFVLGDAPPDPTDAALVASAQGIARALAS